jgi:hypothetical protein
MPNWCSNTIKISGTTEEIDSFEKFLNENNGKNWFDFFVAPAEKTEGVEWYTYNIENYGCKWNCDAQDWHREDDQIEFWFDSPWGPPTKLYDQIQEQGLMVDAEYLEEGMGFVGEYVDGDEETYEFSDVNDLDDIPEHLVENWNLRDTLEGWGDEDDEEFEEEYVDEDREVLDSHYPDGDGYWKEGSEKEDEDGKSNS